MAYAQNTHQLSTTYNPKGLFSFEFRKRDGGFFSTSELFFLLAPQEYSITEGYKVTVRRTISGGYIDDFGNDYKTITLSGEIYAYFEGLAGMISLQGSDEAYKWRYALSRFRDFYNGQHSRTPVSTLDSSKLETLSEPETRYDEMEVRYHDYDDDQHYEVVFEEFTMSRSKDDPFTMKYTIRMKAIRDAAISLWPSFNWLKRWNPMGWVNSLYGVFNQAATFVTNASAPFRQAINSLKSLPNFGLQVADEALAVATGTWKNVVSPWQPLVAEFKQVFETTGDDVRDWLMQRIPADMAKVVGLTEEDITNPDLPLSDPAGLQQVVFPDPAPSPAMLTEMFRLQGQLLNFSIQATSALGLPKVFAEYNTSNPDFSSDQNLVLTEESFPQFSTETGQSGTLTQGLAFWYLIVQGDTPELISRRFFGVSSYGVNILTANNLTNADFENDGMVGRSIVIPGKTGNRLRAETNLVYSTPPPSTATIRERIIAFHGVDLAFDEDAELEADGTGDLMTSVGLDCTADNLLDRLKNPKVNELHPEWGLRFAIGDVPEQAMTAKTKYEILSQVMMDARVNRATIQSLDFTGDVVRVTLNVTPVVGDDMQLEADVLQMTGG